MKGDCPLCSKPIDRHPNEIPGRVLVNCIWFARQMTMMGDLAMFARDLKCGMENFRREHGDSNLVRARVLENVAEHLETIIDYEPIDDAEDPWEPGLPLEDGIWLIRDRETKENLVIQSVRVQGEKSTTRGSIWIVEVEPRRLNDDLVERVLLF